MIDSSEIAVIIQGAFDKLITPQAIASVRQYLPKAEIILSTWQGTALPEDLKVEKIILNEDPGFCFYSNIKGDKKNNVNRQIVSTCQGLKTTQRKYALKMRTDFILTGNNFLNYFDKYKKVNPKYQLFEKKLIACSFFARVPEESKTPLHISDLLFFGLTKDILKLFDIPLMPKQDEYCYKRGKFLHTRYVPEQYIFCACLNKYKMPFKMVNSRDINEDNIEQTHNYFANNFVFLSYSQYSVLPSAMLADISINYRDCYTLVKWKKIYKQYVDSDFVITEKEDPIQKQLIKMRKYYGLLKTLFSIIILPKIRRKYRKAVSRKIFIVMIKKGLV